MLPLCAKRMAHIGLCGMSRVRAAAACGVCRLPRADRRRREGRQSGSIGGRRTFQRQPLRLISGALTQAACGRAVLRTALATGRERQNISTHVTSGAYVLPFTTRRARAARCRTRRARAALFESQASKQPSSLLNSWFASPSPFLLLLLDKRLSLDLPLDKRLSLDPAHGPSMNTRMRRGLT
jgi:hypothetical protein